MILSINTLSKAARYCPHESFHFWHAAPFKTRFKLTCRIGKTFLALLKMHSKVQIEFCTVTSRGRIEVFPAIRAGGVVKECHAWLQTSWIIKDYPFI